MEMCNSKENIETFYEKELQKINQKNLKLKKIKGKVSDNYMWSGKVRIINLVKQIKKDII